MLRLARFPAAMALWLVMLGSGCRHETPRVVLYCGQDREFAEGVLADFTQQTGITVDLRCDTEADKSVSLYEALVRERAAPRCDVFWNNEILHVMRLAKAGLLEPYASPAAADFPAWTRPADRSWQAFAARARILLVDARLPEAERPKNLVDLADPKWRGRVAMAKPLFGTTATHGACLFAAMGEQAAKDFLTRLRPNVAILPGNKDVAVAVGAGRFAVGLTDTDDALDEIRKGRPVTMVYPDQDGLGTLFLPNTLALVRGAPHPAAARKLIDFLLSPAVETALAHGPSGQIPLNPQLKLDLPVATPRTVRAMAIDFTKAAELWEASQTFLRANFTD